MGTLRVERAFFSGIDGAGKTTAVSTAISVMRRCGLEPAVFWMRSLHTFAYIMYSALESSVLGPKIDRDRMRLFPEWARRSGVAWEIIELASVTPKVIRLFLDRKWPAVIDRGPADFIASVYVRTGGRIVYSRPVLEAASRLYRHAILFYLRIPPSRYIIAVRRKRRSLEFSPERLRELALAYDYIVHELLRRGVNVLVVRSDLLTISELKEIISREIQRLFCRKETSTP